MTDVVNIGTNPNDRSGDPLRTAFANLNTFLADLAAAVALLDAAQESGMLGYATLADLNADLAHDAGTVAIVTNDPTPANNIIYRKTGASGAGSWVAQAEGAWASSAVVADLQAEVNVLAAYFQEMTPEDLAWALTDAAGRSVFDIDQTGLARLLNLRAALDGLLHDYHRSDGTLDSRLKLLENAGGYVFSLTDESGRMALGVQTDGTVVCDTLDAATVNTSTMTAPGMMVGGSFDAEICHFYAYGQSWAVGISNAAVSLTQAYDNLMFNGGVRVQSVSDDPGVVYTSLTSLVERDDAGTPEFPTAGAGETPCAGQTAMVKQLLAAENAIAYTDQTYQLLGSAPGEGSKTLTALSKPSAYYTRLLTQMQYGYSLAQAAGKSYVVAAMSWAQGGGAIDTNPDYAADLEALRLDIDADAKATTGQSQDVQLITWQPFPYSDVVLAADLYARYVKAGEDYPNIHCAGAMYHLDHVSDTNIHLSGPGTLALGAYFGLVYKRVVVDKVEWQPLKPLAFFRQGAILIVKFHVPVLPLAIDTVLVVEQTNYGFELLTAAGAQKSITSVSVVGPDTVKIVAAATIGATDRLVYGNLGTAFEYAPNLRKRGNLRDSQGDGIVVPDIDFALHNWCVAFDKTIG